MKLSADQQLAILERGIVDFHAKDELRERLKKSIETDKPLRIKVGFDPTRPDLHLGHTVPISKMRQFQELGHEVIFVVGDFTASIGDPSGKNKTRPSLTKEQIDEGAKTYAEQAFKILDREKTRIEFNSSWLSKMSFADVIRLAGKYTLARMMERDDFKNRYRDNSSISLHELLYPLAQAYDSVHLNCDVEMGGTDQLFNLMVGRDIMREHGQRPQIVMTVPILEGTAARLENGKIVGDKMSKSLDNYVGVSEEPGSQFGKLMSISDDLLWRYAELLSQETAELWTERKQKCAAGEMNPRDAKMLFGQEIVRRFHGEEAADAVKANWDKQFSKREVPDEMPEFEFDSEGANVSLLKLLQVAQLAESGGAARRLIEQNAVQVNGEKASKDSMNQPMVGGAIYVLKAGRKFARVNLK